MAQQLRDSCRKWLLAEGSDVELIIDHVVLEQFITRLPRKTAEWVQCHVAGLSHPIGGGSDGGVPRGRRIPSSCLSPFIFNFSLSPCLSSCPPPQVPSSSSSSGPALGAGWDRTGLCYWVATTAGTDPAYTSPLSPRQSLNPLPSTRAAGRSGPACWRCGDPEHFIDRCPMMEVGTMIRVPDAPQAAPGQAGWYQIP
ncbi:hypothetical protein M9458_002888, partial [Cirrhinus mrigala]